MKYINIIHTIAKPNHFAIMKMDVNQNCAKIILLKSHALFRLIQQIGIISNHVHGSMELVFLLTICFQNKLAPLIQIRQPDGVLILKMVFVFLVIFHFKKNLFQHPSVCVLNY